MLFLLFIVLVVVIAYARLCWLLACYCFVVVFAYALQVQPALSIVSWALALTYVCSTRNGNGDADIDAAADSDARYRCCCCCSKCQQLMKNVPLERPAWLDEFFSSFFFDVLTLAVARGGGAWALQEPLGLNFTCVCVDVWVCVCVWCLFVWKVSRVSTLTVSGYDHAIHFPCWKFSLFSVFFCAPPTTCYMFKIWCVSVFFFALNSCNWHCGVSVWIALPLWSIKRLSPNIEFSTFKSNPPLFVPVPLRPTVPAPLAFAL